MRPVGNSDNPDPAPSRPRRRINFPSKLKSVSGLRLTAIWEAFLVATSSLRANKLRTSLTLMGIVVGVTAVISVVTIIKGLDKTVAQTFSSQGSTVFTISKNPQIIKSREEFIKFNKRKDVTHEDAEAISRLCSSCWRVGVAANALETIKHADQKSDGVRVRGVTPVTMFDIDGVGRYLLRRLTERDFPPFQGTVFLISLVVVTMNLLVDICYAWLDPRIKYT